MSALELTVELGEEYVPGQRHASIKLGVATVFSEIVYDNRESPAELNVVLLFGDRLRRLVEGDL